MKTVLTVDGNSLFHRAFHAFNPERTRKDLPNWGTVGFFNFSARVVEKVEPDCVIIGFDDHLSSRRRSYYPQYKATRVEKDPALGPQLDLTQEVLKALGFNVVVPEGLEADDVTASVAAQAFSMGHQTVVATSDRDAFALINSRVQVLRLVSGGSDLMEFYGDQELKDKYQVYGHQYLDYAALRGDKSDNLPGVKGFGEKSASKLLTLLGSMEVAFADLEEGAELVVEAIGERLKNVLVSPEGRSGFDLTRRMMSTIKDLPVPFNDFVKPDAAILKEVCDRFKLDLTPATIRVLSGVSSQTPEVSKKTHTEVDVFTPSAVNDNLPVSSVAPPSAPPVEGSALMSGVFYPQNIRPSRSLLM